jgi:hypothetical protein
MKNVSLHEQSCGRATVGWIFEFITLLSEAEPILGFGGGSVDAHFYFYLIILLTRQWEFSKRTIVEKKKGAFSKTFGTGGVSSYLDLFLRQSDIVICPSVPWSRLFTSYRAHTRVLSPRLRLHQDVSPVPRTFFGPQSTKPYCMYEHKPHRTHFSLGVPFVVLY